MAAVKTGKILTLMRFREDLGVHVSNKGGSGACVTKVKEQKGAGGTEQRSPGHDGREKLRNQALRGTHPKLLDVTWLLPQRKWLCGSDELLV